MRAHVITGRKSQIEADQRGLGQVYFESAEKYGNRICQIDATTGEEESYHSVKDRSTKLAINMRNLGLTSEDVVLCCIKSSLNSLIPVLSTLYLGAKVCNLDTSQSMKDCAHCISIVKPKYIFVSEGSLKSIENSLVMIGLESNIIVVGNSKKYKTLSELLKPTHEDSSFRPTTVGNCHETAFIYFSSGTTGLPKGICITHFGLLNRRRTILEMDIIDPRVILNFSSLYWISAIGAVTFTFLTGGCLIFSSKFEAAQALRIIETYKVTTTYIPPMCTYQLLDVKGAADYDTSSLRRIILGGSPLSPSQLRKTRELFKQTFVTMVYGSTETLGCATAFDCTRDRHLMDRLESCGRCVVDTEIKIVDVETRKPLCPNQKGEICVKNPYISPGYYNNPSGFCDVEGFVETGDIGYYDDDECIYVVDRIKEMFKYRSWHVVASSLEAILQEHPCVEEAAVFGIPHEVDEFHPAACVILKDAAECGVEEIDQFFTDRVAEYQKLRGGVKIVANLFKSPTGKLQRRRIRELFLKTE